MADSRPTWSKSQRWIPGTLALPCLRKPPWHRCPSGHSTSPSPSSAQTSTLRRPTASAPDPAERCPSTNARCRPNPANDSASKRKSVPSAYVGAFLRRSPVLLLRSVGPWLIQDPPRPHIGGAPQRCSSHSNRCFPCHQIHHPDQANRSAADAH